MAMPNSLSLDVPAVLVAHGKFGIATTKALQRRHHREPGFTAPQIVKITGDEDVESRIDSALTAALDVRLADEECSGREPEVLIIAAAAEWIDLPERLACWAVAARRSLLRSNLRGRVRILLYWGPIGHRFPDHAQASSLDETIREAFDTAILFADTDLRKRRWRHEDVLAALAQWLDVFLTSSAVRRQLDDAAGYGERACVAVGTLQLNLQEADAQQCLQSAFRRALHDRLCPPNLDSNGEKQADHKEAAHFHGDLQVIPETRNLTELARSIDIAYGQAVTRWRQTALCAMADQTRSAIESLLPLPPTKRISWWRRLLIAIISLLYRGSRVRPDQEWAPPEAMPGARHNNSLSADEASFQYLAEWRTRVAALQLALQPLGKERSNRLPLELGIAELASFQVIATQILPDIECLAWQFMRPSNLEEMTASADISAVREKLDAWCSKACALSAGARHLTPKICRDAILEVARLVTPLFPLGGSRTSQLALLPPGASDWFGLDHWRKSSGRKDEVLLCTLEYGVSLLTLIEFANPNDEVAQSVLPS